MWEVSRRRMAIRRISIWIGRVERTNQLICRLVKRVYQGNHHKNIITREGRKRLQIRSCQFLIELAELEKKCVKCRDEGEKGLRVSVVTAMTTAKARRSTKSTE